MLRNVYFVVMILKNFNTCFICTSLLVVLLIRVFFYIQNGLPSRCNNKFLKFQRKITLLESGPTYIRHMIYLKKINTWRIMVLYTCLSWEIHFQFDDGPTSLYISSNLSHQSRSTKFPWSHIYPRVIFIVGKIF